MSEQKKVGRPRLPREELQVQLHIRVPYSYLKQMEQEAIESRSLVSRVVKKHLGLV
jgi:hypothetical protein